MEKTKNEAAPLSLFKLLHFPLHPVVDAQEVARLTIVLAGEIKVDTCTWICLPVQVAIAISL